MSRVPQRRFTLAEAVVDTNEINAARKLAARYQFQFVDLRDSRPDSELLRTIPLELMLHYEFLPLEGDDHRLVIVVAFVLIAFYLPLFSMAAMVH